MRRCFTSQSLSLHRFFHCIFRRNACAYVIEIATQRFFCASHKSGAEMTSGHELSEFPHGKSNTASKHCRGEYKGCGSNCLRLCFAVVPMMTSVSPSIHAGKNEVSPEEEEEEDLLDRCQA
jgi:hypothetical protein